MKSLRTKYSLSHRCRSALLTLLFSAFGMSAAVWDGTSVSSSLAGDGTAEHPYEVASGADLKLIQSDTSYWGQNLHFLQIDDIDLGGHELGLIGYGDGTKTGNDINNTAYKPFFGIYDGGAHKISNLLVYWDIPDNQHHSAGLFGLLAGCVRNLHIDNARITRSASAKPSDNKVDMRIGIVAGAASPNKSGDKQVRIENIIISNSVIDDGGIATDLKTYFVGGVVGDVSCGFGGTSPISSSNYGYVHIRNIYAHVDMDFSNCVRTTSDQGSITQFDIGGMVGRMRRGKYSDLPVDVIFKGMINAPRAAIAPYICMSRCNGINNVNGMNDAYLGEVLSSNTTSSTNAFTKMTADGLKIAGVVTHPNDNRFFFGYKIWDSAVGDYVEITSNYPAADDNRYGIRTLDPDGSTLTVNAPPSMMRSWQGVNHGSYINMRTNIGATTATNRLNSLNDPVKFAWDAENETFRFSASENVTLARNSLHSILATVYNDNRTSDYIYTWTLTDRDGNAHTFETTKTGAGDFSSPHVDIDVSLNSCRLTIKDDFRNYTKARLTLYDLAGHSLSTAELDLPDFGLTFKRSTEKTDKVRYHFSPEFSFDDEELASTDPLLDNLTYSWNAYKWDGSEWTLDNSYIYSGANSQEVVVTNEFIGSVRLVVTDTEIPGRPYILTSDGTVDYMEQVLERLRLSFTIKQMQLDANGNYTGSTSFDPTKYFTGSTGYDVTYTYDDSKTSGIRIVDQLGNEHFLADTITGASPRNISGTLRDTNILPLIFEGTVVDQFGNVVEYDPDKYRIQWSFRIPDSRSNKTFPPGLDWDSSTGYVIANGREVADISSDIRGNGIDWVGEYYRNAGNKTTQFACDRWGEYAVEGSTTFKIHPNLLHCTSTFDVRAVLYDVSDEGNPTSVETVVSFSQVDFITEAVPDGYKATVSWRAGDKPYTSGSKYSFVWYSNPDPTDYDGWTVVEGAGVDYITNGFPSDYNGDRNRYSVITGVDPTLFYKVEFRTASGTFIEGITGPENVIFVYDRARTLENPDFHDFDVYDVQTNYYFPQGNDTNHGRDPWHAVATMSQAFQMLDREGSYKTNRIVVMGYYHEYDRSNPSANKNYFMHSSWWEKNPASPVTISGAYGSYIKGGTLGLGYESTTGAFDVFLNSPMRWENLTLFSYNTCDTQNTLYACNHDFILGRGVRLINFRAMNKSAGLADTVKVPNFTIVAGQLDYMTSSKAWLNPLAEMDGAHKIDFTGNETDNLTTIKILSGGIGRVIGASRNSGDRNKKTPGLFGTPTNPNRVRIEIDIAHEPGKEKEYLPDWIVLKPDGTPATGSAEVFTHDIGIVVGGQTDGSTFSDTEYTVRNGHVARYVSGNITFGRPSTAYDSSYHFPDDTYFGRTVLNIYGGTFDEIYGGSLGRSGYTESNDMVKAFFYGHSVINLYGGVIGSEVSPTAAKLFAAGAGGVTGKGSHWKVDGRLNTDERRTYTPDDHIPFLKADDSIEFRPFNEASPSDRMPQMNCIDSEGNPYLLDLNDSRVELNLYGGTVYGDVYGGGLGYASNLKYSRAPYRKLTNTAELQSLAGNLYGTSYVRLLPNPDPDSPDVVIMGNVYGAGAGDDTYIRKAETDGETIDLDGTTYTFNFTEVAKTFGNSHVEISGGRVMGSVYGAGCGIGQYNEMANIYGDASLQISGGTIEGNIYGGAAYSDIRKYSFTNAEDVEEEGGGNTRLQISGGTIGNCIFGGGEGTYVAPGSPLNAASNVSGDVYLEISGGTFSENPYKSASDETLKPFNIYGGGYNNGIIGGDTHVRITASLLRSNESVYRPFAEAWNDILMRRFCVYGAGYGENTRVKGNTYVDIDIARTESTVLPTIDDIDHLIPGQTIFDVAGGGYSGNAGYWMDDGGAPIYTPKDHDVEKYDHYVGGKLHVNIKGYPFIRKVIGGSFYAECDNTNTYIESGSVKEVYGGALMGYVHDNARLNIGSKAIDGRQSSGFAAEVLKDAASAAECNSRLFITGNVFGGNDVKGIVGTTFWTNDEPGANNGKRGIESVDGAPLYCSDVSQAVNKGVTLLIHGGTIGGNVYGAGNGHYRGYYVPDWVRYDDGPDRHYRKVRLIDGSSTTYGKVYRCRPMTGSVTMHVGGNSASDRVNIRGNLYGGGRSCTIGQWNTALPYEDPRRLVKAGFLHVNFGSHVDVNSVYMGTQGDDFMRPKELLRSGLTIGDGNFPETLDLDELGDIAYDHWYLSSDGTQYLPGFPAPGEVDGNYGMLGAHMLRAYAKNIEMNADIELTFYSNPFKLDVSGKPVMSDDPDPAVVCKKWLPAEKAHTDYDSSDLTFTNFFGGGASGFMTNNKLMRYNYTTGEPVPDITYTYYQNGSDYGVEYDFHNDPKADIERFGTIYRYSLPPGLTVLDKVVGGSEDAIDSAYAYSVNPDGTITLTDDLQYTFEGGMVTQCSYSYDLIVHNDKYYSGYNGNLDHAIPAEHFAQNYEDGYQLQNGPDAGLTIYRQPIPATVLNPTSVAITGHRYDMAYYYDEEKDPLHTKKLAYCGPREDRIEGNETVLKLTVACQFDPQEGDSEPAEGESADGHEKHYGGVIYGGCYNSGVTQGDVMVTVSANTVGGHQDVTNPDAFGQISSLAHNVGRVFGGGYGVNSRVDGDTYVNLLLDFVGMNVFGGGCRGNVNGTAHVKYLGNEDNSYVLGAIYGGGLYGSVGVKDVTPVATDVRLFSGNVDRVYGGSCLGDLYGRTNVELCDEVTSGLEYFDYDRLLDNDDIFDWGGSRLIVGTVFGGNDVAGRIIPQPSVTDPEAEGDEDKDTYATYVRTYETPHIADPEEGGEGGEINTESTSAGPGKQTPGSAGAYNGYPLIGYLYAGSNGNYGVHGKDAADKDIYVADADGNPTYITLATGVGNATMRLKLNGEDEGASTYPPFEIPHVSRSRLDITGGTIVNAYGGGDRATITEKSQINVHYLEDNDVMDARAGFISEDDFVRTWNTCHLSHTDQIDEVTEMRENEKGGSDRVFRYHVFRLFGGNDKAPMAIQPTWNLVSGHLGNVYSGGNFGAMTYFGRDAEGKPQSLTLEVDSPNFHTAAIYGGGRVGDIVPAVDADFLTHEAAYEAKPSATNEVHDFYGATLSIKQGIIDHVYGGNDVSGNVKYGTRVLLNGAISGDVYCAGNGNYLYKYDKDYEGTEIVETFDEKLGRYFQLPLCDAYGLEDVERLLAINHYRPNVDRSFLHIEGSREPDTVDEGGNPVKGDINYAYVRGNVYCGGNSSTVGVSSKTRLDSITFDIGKYVMLNGVFLGSNGENLVDPAMMRAFEELNNLNLAKESETFSEEYLADHYHEGFALHDREVVAPGSPFPRLLDVYMRAVDVYGTPRDFQMAPENIEESYIGDFFVGGNRGSMLTNSTISLTFPHDLVIFGKIVGGSNNANVTYKNYTHEGGLTRPVVSDDPEKNPDKVYLQILSKFEPWKMTYPAKNAAGKTDYRVIKVVPDVEEINNDLYFPESKCSVFGGCFNSGRTVGNIHIDLYSDLAGEYDPGSRIYKEIEETYGIGTGDGDTSKERIIVNGIDDLQRRSFALVGAGYGSETSVLGNIRLHMLPGKFHPSFVAGHNEDPSAATIFAGSEKGKVIGNTEITVRDGLVLSNLYGGSESSTLYGSTNIIIGWPQYLVCQKTGHYLLDRTDTQSQAASVAAGTTREEPIKKSIRLCKGDYVSVNLYRQMAHTQPDTLGVTFHDVDAANPYGAFKDGEGNDAFKYVGDDTPDKYAAHNNSPYVHFHDITWDDINIYIGNNKSRLTDRAEYYAHGNIYGGGFITANSGTTLAGEYTVRKYNESNNPDPSLIGYGGNSTILIWDNPDNANPANPVGGRVRKVVEGNLEGENAGSGPVVRDHITIGTGHYKPVNLLPGQDAMGYYVFKPDPDQENPVGRYEYNGQRGMYVHQSAHIIPEDEGIQYFEIESDGGIYGGGRKVYVEGFRNCDLQGYGYADYTPQFPKLLNTAQRLDLFTITDCCLMMQGAVDFASNSIDATRYSMTRIGELEMRSSIDPQTALGSGRRDDTALANVLHNEPRMRNYLAFFHDVLYLSAMTSSEAFTNPYRGANGVLGYIGNFTKTGTDTSDHSVPTESDYVALDYATEPFSYRQYKANRIGNYYANRNQPDQITQGDTKVDNPVKLITSLEFDQRNVGTAANMIGISNGYTLKVQGEIINKSGPDKLYYGPVNGVFEVKLMTLATDEGGGYIYALNQHDDPNHFLQTSGNFVFPGAAYRKSSQRSAASAPAKRDTPAEGEGEGEGESEGEGEGESTEDYNYVYDDCYPMGKGWDSYWGWDSTKASETTSVMGPELHRDPVARAELTGNGVVCDDAENGGTDIHFWYVNGTNFYFNVTLTAYTFNEPQYFLLNKNEDLIYLYGVDSGSDIELESATWAPLSEINTGGYVSDLRDLERCPDDYQLFLSIDDTPHSDHTIGTELGVQPAVPDGQSDNHAYITRVPRADLAEGSTADALYTATAPYEHFSASSPLLGITLYDKCRDNAKKAYYDEHLSKEEQVRLVLTATSPTSGPEARPATRSVGARDAESESEALKFKYTINLTVKYVKGPSIEGNLLIENDALPGEYIYANAYGVNVDIDDENMGISDRKWYLVGSDCDISSNTKIQEYFDTGAPVDINDQLISDVDRRQVHIPAYRYRDGWNVVYEIVANGLSFFVTPAPEPAEVEGEEGEGETPAVPTFHKLGVHNYHRMKPTIPLSNEVEQLRLSEGSWIYIEDDDDMAYFFEWLAGLQAEGCETLCDGVVTNPRYAAGLTVQLLNDVAMPADADSRSLRFDGTFHGNGHNIAMGNNELFLGDNHGTFYNTGFITSRTSSSGASAFGANYGRVECCFFYNDQKVDKGKMIGDAGDTGTLVNCFTNSTLDSQNPPEGLEFASADDFRYGRVAYNLNRFYLQERYNRNVSEGLRDYTAVKPVTDKFSDGEYRFGAVHTDDYPFLLRTVAVPNYRDYLGLRINATTEQVTSGAVSGTVATMHDVTHPVDESRAVKVDNKVTGYAPIFDSDYLFFGQDLTYGTTDLYPHAAYASTRVYRASGFFGSKTDEGFHFNRDVQALQPGLTAVDFTGVRDAAKDNAYTTGRTQYAEQKVWFGPQLDLPAGFSDCTFDVGSRLQKVNTGSIPDSHITRNLLVYRNAGTLDSASDLLYGTETPFEEVYCHVVDIPATGNPNVDYVQLVDREDFNAPIAFDVNRTIWYRRSPALWASNGDGWEGICLPFTANITYGSVSSREPNSVKNHGLMTHFYGNPKAYDAEEDGTDYWTRETHEYWLRKFTHIDGNKAYFERPASTKDAAVNPSDAEYPSYHYANEYFLNAYGDFRYNEDGTTQHMPPAYTAAGTDYVKYPMLTAGYPYLVSFPGKRYLEFDCSGEYYTAQTGNGDADPQIITFAWDQEKARDGETVMPIGVSDEQLVQFAHDGKVFIGTFKHCRATKTDIVVDTEGGASQLVRPGNTEERTVEPFRAYMRGSASPTPLKIASSAPDTIGNGDGEEPEEGPEDDLGASLRIYLDGRVLVIENPYDESLSTPLCDVAGRVLRVLEIAPGENRYSDLTRGIYLMESFKFYIP